MFVFKGEQFFVYHGWNVAYHDFTGKEETGS